MAKSKTKITKKSTKTTTGKKNDMMMSESEMKNKMKKGKSFGMMMKGY